MFWKIVFLRCSIYIYAPNIILCITNPLDPDNTCKQILILKYYLHKCRCLGNIPSVNGGLKCLKYFYWNRKDNHKYFILYTKWIYRLCKKWLPFETVLGVWNFSAVLQNVCADKLNVFFLCKIVYAYNFVFLFEYASAFLTPLALLICKVW